MLSACSPADPPTITAPPPGSAEAGVDVQMPGPTRVFEITMPPPATADLSQIEPVDIHDRTVYRDADGAFSVEVPIGWGERRQDIVDGAVDVKLGTVFLGPDGNGLVSVTQFDNGTRPQSLGITTNQVLKMTGWLDQPDYREVRRESVIDRQDEALRLEVSYLRANGIPMRSLVLFQIDGTTFSMVNIALEQGSWLANEGELRDLLGSYRVPAVAGGAADDSAGAGGEAAGASDGQGEDAPVDEALDAADDSAGSEEGDSEGSGDENGSAP
jgi:hypothetical protein